MLKCAPLNRHYVWDIRTVSKIACAITYLVVNLKQLLLIEVCIGFQYSHVYRLSVRL